MINQLIEAIPVTAKHISEGQAKSFKYCPIAFCPIALALSEYYNHVWVGPDDILIRDGIDAPKKYCVGWRVRDWIEAFDCRLDWVKPFVLILDHKNQSASMKEIRDILTSAANHVCTHGNQITDAIWLLDKSDDDAYQIIMHAREDL